MDQFISYAKKLRLAYFASNMDFHIKEAQAENKSYEDFLLGLLQGETELRHQNGITSRIRNAKFPYQKTLDALDIKLLPKGAKDSFQNLRTLDFIKDKQNIIFAGNPGTGKTHYAIGLGIKACIQGNSVYFAHVPNLIIELKEARNDLRLQRLKSKFDKYDLIILDELGYTSFDKEGAELLFNFISSRNERASTIITTHLSFDRWNEVFHDEIITAALVDRVTHRSYVVNMSGNSYRLKETVDFLKNTEH